MKRIFSDWFNNAAKEYPDINLGAIRKVLYKAYCDGFDLAYSRGYRQGFDDCTKDVPEPEVIIVEGAPLNPTPEMINAGVSVLRVDEIVDMQALVERMWRVMWAAK